MVAPPPPLPPVAYVAAAPKPKCPRCGADDVQLLSSQQMFAPTLKQQSHPLRLTISTHKCPCGIRFTDTITRED